MSLYRDTMIEENCINNLKLDRDKLRYTTFESDTSENDEESGRFYACVWKGRGLINQSGVVDWTSVEDFIREVFFHTFIDEKRRTDMLDEIHGHCVNIQRETVEQTAVKLKNCILETVQSAGPILLINK